ncbi:hypothetical protein ABH945_006081 [Paraburkholderia sp. GAS333]
MLWTSHTLELVNTTGQFHQLDFIDISKHVKLQLMLREGAILTRPAEFFIRCIENTNEIFSLPLK